MLEVEGTPCYALPGVPFEMKAMFAQEVAPRLQAVAEGHVLLTRYLHCFGRAEADIGEDIRDLMAAGRNPSVGTSADAGVIGIRITAAAETRAAAESMLGDLERDVRDRLGETVFGRGAETLPSVVGQLLAAVSRTVSTAESCTGGLIGELLTDVAGSSRYYVGGVVAYADEVKQRLLGVPRALLEEHGAVSEPVARAMAEGARSRLSSDYALSVTGIAGPEGGGPEKPIGLVYIGLASPASVSVQECRFGRGTMRQVVRARAARTALNLLRLELRGAAGGR
jgi:nicotinamide-nucleotide amidase